MLLCQRVTTKPDENGNTRAVWLEYLVDDDEPLAAVDKPSRVVLENYNRPALLGWHVSLPEIEVSPGAWREIIKAAKKRGMYIEST
jgi:hypothetical protein